MNSSQEQQNLNRIAADSWYATGANAEMIRYCFAVFSRFIRPGSVLELGPAEGIMSEKLATVASKLTLVDGAENFCAMLRAKLPQAEVVHSLFEDYRPARKFDTIILGHVLEHVENPVAILKLIRPWLASGGKILAAVPNARSVHRQAAVLMGMLPGEDSMNESDIHHGHRRVFNPESFRAAFSQAGLVVEVFGGYWLKPVSNRQIQETWTPQMLHAFMQLGERYPDIAAEIYVVASNP